MELTLKLDQSQIDGIAAQAGEIAFQKLMSRTLGSVITKSFPKIGEFWPEQGGFLGAIMRGHNGQQDYCLIVADKEHEFTSEFGSRGKEEIATNDFDGFENTKLMVESEHAYPAAEKCSALTINGHGDFYLASRREMRALFSNSSELFDPNPWYWTSMQYSAGNAYFQAFGDGSQGSLDKDDELRVRPVRRLFI